MAGTRIGQQQQSAIIQDLATKVQKLVSPGPGFSDPTQIFRVTKGVAAGNVNIAFRIAKVPGVSNVQIYRNVTRDFGTASQLTQFTAAISEANIVNFSDTNAALTGKQLFYWLRITPVNQNVAPIAHGPVAIVAP